MNDVTRQMRSVLFASSEVHPLAKTGGLGDVSASLPAALRAAGTDVRIVLPGYRDTLARAGTTREVSRLQLPRGTAVLRETTLADAGVPVYLVDHPPSFDRAGGPYSSADGPWPDNASRFALFCDAIVDIALNRAGLGWQPSIVHGNDWQTGLAFPWLSRSPQAPATIFTIHNLAYQGVFPQSTFASLGLPAEWWNYQALEYHNQFSFMKGGLVFADRLTTVSPTYAQEIQTPEYGHGLDGLLRHRAGALSGILNGIDVAEWNPSADPALGKPYDAASLEDKLPNKLSLQAELGLSGTPDTPLLGVVGRLAEQKGIDLILAAMPEILRTGSQIVVLASGDPALEQGWRDCAMRHPRQVAVRTAYDEKLAHRIEAGVDMFLMPSRFEPCGLNQMYSQRYGTIPIVRRTGGLADTVVHADDRSIAEGTATGVVFDNADVNGLVWAIHHALWLFKDVERWRKIQRAGMRQDFSWKRAARQYLDLYGEALKT